MLQVFSREDRSSRTDQFIRKKYSESHLNMLYTNEFCHEQRKTKRITNKTDF